MKFKVLFVLLLYYTVVSLLFLAEGSVFTEGAGYNESTETALNETLSEEELDTGGLFGTGISFGRYLGFVTVGIGLPDDTPGWFQLIFSAWQTIVTLIAIAFVISAVWDG